MKSLKASKTNTIRITSLTIAATIFSTVVMPSSLVFANELPGSGGESNTSVNAGEITNALQETDGILESSDQVKATSDTDSAVRTVIAGSVVDIPMDASDGVSFGAANDNTPAIDISLPNADSAENANKVAPGTVAYPATNGSANAVQATKDGGVRMLTVIDNPVAPTAYGYKVTVPNGGMIELTEEGSAVVKDGSNEAIAAVAKPWAKDANGTPIETYFTTDGSTLVQHIKHNVTGVVYPVTADPFWIPAWVVAATVSAMATALKWCGLGALAGSAWQVVWSDWVWREVVRAGKQGCVEGIVGRIVGWGWARYIIRR